MKKVSTGILLIAALIIAILATEPFIVDYPAGHFGWVSLHSLAIAKNTRIDNFLVGYTCNYDGFLNYFSRYPIFFNLATKFLLKPFEANSALHLYLSRQLMNIIYISTVYVLFLIAKNLLSSDTKALAATILSSTGFMILRYKNMYHFDQPGLLAFLVFILILSKHNLIELNRNRGKFLLATALLSMVGRCYIIVFGCLVWLALEILKKLNIGKNFKSTDFNLKLPFFALFTSSFTIGINIFFNILIEAHINHTSILNTSVVASAVKRLGLNQDFNIEKKQALGTIQFSIEQFKRFSSNFIPESMVDVYSSLRILIMITLVLLLGYVLRLLFIEFISNKDPHRSAQAKIQIILFSTGPIWLFVMKNLSAFHPYTAIYYIGTYLILWIFLLNSIQKKAVYRLVLFLVTGLFVVSLFRVKQLNVVITNPINYSSLDKYAQVLNAEHAPTVYVEGGHRNFIENSPYALCYFLPLSQLVDSIESADYVLEQSEINGYMLEKRK